MKPGKPVVVLPLVPEFIRNEDGKEKQDCERNVAKRWINRHTGRYGPLNITILGDDLYAPFDMRVPGGGGNGTTGIIWCTGISG
ncbi:MAG: hypothetical protein LBP76_03455 [Treponema sp.]|nr:hypothetical protein [Treponema sp.]